MSATKGLGRPVRPDELHKEIPGEVFDVVNELLAQSLIVKQDAVVEAVCARLQCSRQEVYDRGWLNFEPNYREAGWGVTYDKPVRDDSYGAFWEFIR